MKKSYSIRRIICRLLTLLLIVLVGVGSAANQVNGASIGGAFNPLLNVDLNYIFNKSASINKDLSGGSTNIRKHLLYNMCSERLVKIIRKGSKGVIARGKQEMEFSKLIFESTPSRTIRIFGEHSGYHICFSKRGKVISRSNGKRKSCEFIEEYSADERYTHYKSADTRHTWYLGFKKNGKPLKGTSLYNSSKKEDCFKFIKIHKQPVGCTSSGRGPVDLNLCEIWKNIKQNANNKRHSRQRVNRKRHSKHHPSRRKG